jgi:cell division protein FtsB
LIFEKLNNKYQIGEEFKSKLSDQFSQKAISLIVIEDLKKLEEIIPKIIINEGDPDKKGRNILINKEYTSIGISQLESEGDISIILIFSKIKEKSENIESNELNNFSLSKEENSIFEQIKEFRQNPKKFLDKKDFVKNKKRKEYENFINTLEKMPELVPDKELCDLAKEEVKKFSEDSDYNKFQIGEEIKFNISEKFSKNNIGLIAIDEIENIELLIPNIIIN